MLFTWYRFPHCLHFLDLLQQPEFRARVARLDFATAVAWQQYYFWLFYRKNRVREGLADAGGTNNEKEGNAQEGWGDAGVAMDTGL